MMGGGRRVAAGVYAVSMKRYRRAGDLMLADIMRRADIREALNNQKISESRKIVGIGRINMAEARRLRR